MGAGESGSAADFGAGAGSRGPQSGPLDSRWDGQGDGPVRVETREPGQVLGP